MAESFSPALASDEHILLQDQGAYNSGRSWQLGRVFLTDRRLLFAQGNRQRVDIPLADVSEMGIEKRRFVLAAKPCLVVHWRVSGRKVWLTVPHVEKWRNAIAGFVEGQSVVLHSEDKRLQATVPESRFGGARSRDVPRVVGPASRLTAEESDDIAMGRQRALQIVSEARRRRGQESFPAEGIAQLVLLLDPASARLVWYIWENRHAKLDELTDALRETSHMGALIRIREEVNPLAVRLLGRPLFVFERIRFDRQTGQQVLFSWWLNEGATREPAAQPEFVDVLDEGDHLLVLLELPGVSEEDIMLNVANSTLIVTVETAERSYREQVCLPAGVDTDLPAASYRNGVLQVRLSKEPIS